MNDIWIIKVTNDDNTVSISSDGYRSLELAKSSLNRRLGGDVHWISEFICRQIIDSKIFYYELHCVSVVK